MKNATSKKIADERSQSWRGAADHGERTDDINDPRKSPTSALSEGVGLLFMAFMRILDIFGRGTAIAESVGRISLADGGAGTGFLVGRRLLLTNNHVLPDAAPRPGRSWSSTSSWGRTAGRRRRLRSTWTPARCSSPTPRSTRVSWPSHRRAVWWPATSTGGTSCSSSRGRSSSARPRTSSGIPRGAGRRSRSGTTGSSTSSRTSSTTRRTPSRATPDRRCSTTSGRSSRSTTPASRGRTTPASGSRPTARCGTARWATPRSRGWPTRARGSPWCSRGCGRWRARPRRRRSSTSSASRRWSGRGRRRVRCVRRGRPARSPAAPASGLSRRHHRTSSSCTAGPSRAGTRWCSGRSGRVASPAGSVPWGARPSTRRASGSPSTVTSSPSWPDRPRSSARSSRTTGRRRPCARHRRPRRPAPPTPP